MKRVKIQVGLCLPVTADLLCEVRDDGEVHVLGGQIAIIQAALTERSVMENVHDEDLDEIERLAREAAEKA